MYITIIKKWFFQTLLKHIPDYLIRMLESFSKTAGLWNSSQESTQARVYDLVNCGPDTRFVSGIDYNLITSNCQYGAGVRKVHQSLEEQEIYLSYNEVENIHSGYWELFSKVKDFGRSLQFERRRNKGYILNGTGRPMAIPDEFEKDLLNRFIQSTGHDILTIYITLLSRNLDAMGIEWTPWVIDWHDATAVEVDEKDRDKVVKCFESTMEELNAMLQGTIKLKGTPSWGYTMSDIKEPEG